MIVLSEEFEEMLNAMAASKHPVLQDFYGKVKSFVHTTKYGNAKTTVMYINKNDVKVGKFDQPEKLLSYMTVSKSRKAKGNAEPMNEIVFEHINHSDVLKSKMAGKIEEATLRQFEGALRFKTEDGSKMATLTVCDGKKNKAFTFEVKGNKVTKFAETTVQPSKEK